MTDPQYIKGGIDATGCISNAWEMIKPNYWLFFGISLLTYVLIACIPCINVILMGPVMGGVYYTAFRAMRGEPIEFGMMFKGFERFVPLMVVGIVQPGRAILFNLDRAEGGFGIVGDIAQALARAADQNRAGR